MDALLLPTELIRLAKELERASPGREVWRVAGADGAYCMEFDHGDCSNPKRECELWLQSHADYCAARGYTVQSARCYTQTEHTAQDVAARLRQLVSGAA